MTTQDEKKVANLDLEKELSRYWFCPNDRNMLQIHHTKQSQNPYFLINRKNIEIGIQNAIALRKIAPEAKEQTERLVNFIFEKDPIKFTIHDRLAHLMLQPIIICSLKMGSMGIQDQF